MAVVQGLLHWMQACVVLLLCLSEAVPAASETNRNYYDTLSIESTATDSQIKKAFRKLAIKHHPDKNKSADAEKTFREIAEGKTRLQHTGPGGEVNSTKEIRVQALSLPGLNNTKE
uniref:DnaJ homolog subfamily B member 9 n=2 Tax=Seriola TaxID=8160 RepID=A0A3B4TQJ1_SERDU